MAVKKKTAGKTPQKSPMSSNSAKAKQIIREEIKACFNPKEYGVRSALDAMKIDAESACAGRDSGLSDFAKGAKLVQNGGLAIYYDDQRAMLRKIYGDKVDGWANDKVHNTYKNLVGREYAAMLSEREKAKQKKAEERARKKEQTARKKTRIK